MRNIFQPITGDIFFVSPQWEEIRLNLVSTHFMCTQCPVLCLTSHADLSVTVIIGSMCVLCAAKAAVMPAFSGFIMWYTLERYHISVSFVGKNLLLDVNWRNAGFHIQKRSHTCVHDVWQGINTVWRSMETLTDWHRWKLFCCTYCGKGFTDNSN